jgi:DNA repair photolyase
MSIEVFTEEKKSGIKRNKEFQKKRLAEFTVNVGTRCGHACEYCSSKSLYRTQSFFQQPEIRERGITSFTRGIAVVDPTVVGRIAHEAKCKRKRGLVLICSATDAWAPEARELDLGRGILEAILGQDRWSVRVLTKSACVANDFDVMRRKCDRVRFGISLTATPATEDACAVIEPHASTIQERMDAIRQASKLGLRTYGMLCPLLPMIANQPHQIEELVEFMVSCGAEEIFVEGVNPRGRWSEDY